jgi:hypothetical protein
LLDSLESALDNSDCAVFVFPPDHQGLPDSVYRDTLFQLGIMVGRVGRERTFVVVPSGMAQEVIPTPLLGIGIAEYDANRADHNLRAAAGIAASLIRDELIRLGPRMANHPLHDFPKSFEARLAAAQDIYFWGMNQSDFLIRHYDTLRSIMSGGARVRALLVAPRGLAVRATRLRFSGSVEVDHETFRAKSSLTRLCKLQTEFPDNVDLRTLDYPFSYGAFLFDAGSPEAIVYVKQYTFRTTGGSRKPKFVHESGRTPWYEIVELEGQQLWEAGSPYACKSTAKKANSNSAAASP